MYKSNSHIIRITVYYSLIFNLFYYLMYRPLDESRTRLEVGPLEVGSFSRANKVANKVGLLEVGPLEVGPDNAEIGQAAKELKLFIKCLKD